MTPHKHIVLFTVEEQMEVVSTLLSNVEQFVRERTQQQVEESLSFRRINIQEPTTLQYVLYSFISFALTFLVTCLSVVV